MGLSLFLSCSTKINFKIANNVDIDKFVTTWYVIAGRFTSFEDGAHNPVEKYYWSEDRKMIHVEFSFLKDSFEGEKKTIPQKAWVYDKESNAHWKIQPFWPLMLNYLIIAHAKDYSWSAVGVPDQKYLWIMSKKPKMSEDDYSQVIQTLELRGYSTKNIVKAPQKWN